MQGVHTVADSDLIDCSPGYSFFFDLVRAEYAANNNFAPLHRICTLMRKMHVRSLLRESLELSGAEISAELAAATTRTGGNVTGKAVRFTFFRALPASNNWRDLHDND